MAAFVTPNHPITQSAHYCVQPQCFIHRGAGAENRILRSAPEQTNHEQRSSDTTAAEVTKGGRIVVGLKAAPTGISACRLPKTLKSTACLNFNVDFSSPRTLSRFTAILMYRRYCGDMLVYVWYDPRNDGTKIPPLIGIGELDRPSRCKISVASKQLIRRDPLSVILCGYHGHHRALTMVRLNASQIRLGRAFRNIPLNNHPKSTPGGRSDRSLIAMFLLSCP